MRHPKSNGDNAVGRAIGARNRDRIRTYMLDHIGATNAECGQALGLSDMAVGRHIMALKAEWKTKPKPRKRAKSK